MPTIWFRHSAGAVLEREKAQAELDFIAACGAIPVTIPEEKKITEIELLLFLYVQHRFMVFAEEALNGRSDTMTVRGALEEYLPIAVNKAFESKHPHAMTVKRRESLGRFHSLVRYGFARPGSGWQELQRNLKERAELEERTMQQAALSAEANNGAKEADEKQQLVETDAQRAARRRARVYPLLTDRGWSIGDWQRNANVPKYDTAKAFLNGKNSRPETRKKLAAALGVSVSDLL